MISLHGIASAGAAFSYFSERDDYYRAEASSAEWYGHGAEQAKLSGDVDPQDFRAVLEGRVDDAQVGRADAHAPGWDMTFSAPKSVSIAALINRDQRLVEAHDRATRAALKHVERHALVTRQRDENGQYTFRTTDSMTAAVFRHASSRNHDPQLHSHAVIANVTRDPETGRWVSVHSRDLYRVQAEAGVVYTNELAHAARQAGYTVDWSINPKGNPTFELREVPAHVREAFSTRTTERNAELREHGIDPATASAKAKEAAVLETRNPKEHVPATELHARWKEQARDLGYDAMRTPEGVTHSRETAARAADAAVTAGIAHLSERETRFTERELMHQSRIAAQGHASDTNLKAAVQRAWDRGDLITRETWQRGAGNARVRGDGFTTRQGIETEQSMLRHAERIDQHVQRSGPMVRESATHTVEAAIAAREQTTGHAFTTEQREAVHGILQDRTGLHVVQGHAGTAKTSTVLAAVADVAKESGWEIRAMASTGSAAQSLGDAIGARSETVTAAIHADGRPKDYHDAAQVWIVDEAGMVSAKDMNALLAAAERQRAHVVLVGDERQIGSVGAGAAFTQLKAQHHAYELTEIKRQNSEQLKAAVYDAIRGDMAAALNKVNVTEHKERDSAIAAIADRYQHHVQGGRDTLVVTLSRDDRRDVNTVIQAARVEAGEVRNVQAVTVLDSKQWTPAQQADAARYQTGDVIEARRGFKNGPQRGETWIVTESRDGRVTVQGDRGAWTFDPKRVNAFQVHTAHELQLGEGDRIVAKGNLAARNTNGEAMQLRTGEMLTVERFDGAAITATRANGQTALLDASHGLRIDLGYAQTANQAQGKTSDAVIGYMRSGQTNLADQTRAYVTLSRAREHADVFTDNKQRLAETLEHNPGIKETASLRDHEAHMPGSPESAVRSDDYSRSFVLPASRDSTADLGGDHDVRAESLDRGAGLDR